MKRYVGKGVCSGVALGVAEILKKEEITVQKTPCSNTKEEIIKYEKAKNTAKSQLDLIYHKALKEVGEANAQIFSIHMMMLDDEDFNDAVKNIITTQQVCAEYAVFTAGNNFADMFFAMEDSYMKERAADVKDISRRIMDILSNEQTAFNSKSEKAVICAYDLAPSETVSLDKNNILGFVTAAGSSNSHTAILARNMDIPAVIGVGKDFLDEISNGDFIIVDGYSGEVFVNPDEKTASLMLNKQKEDEERKKLLLGLKGKSCETLDGVHIDLFANIGSIGEIGAAIFNDADGIGLFRSEFLYLSRSDYPSEEEQFEVYKKALESMAGKRVIIRTLDIGADKQAPYFNLKSEENPALGNRGIRLCFSKPEVFKTQLRALLRASAFGNLGIMFPMITSVKEVDKALQIVKDVKKDLENEGDAASKNLQLGIMIETPAAALVSDELAQRVDFFSIGTNDLTQYTLACDRQNYDVESYCDTHHKAILDLIKMTVENGHRNNCWVGICGELAGDTTLAERFLRMGVDELSVSVGSILKLKDKIRKMKLN